MAYADLDAERVVRACDSALATLEQEPCDMPESGSVYERNKINPKLVELDALRALRALAACAVDTLNGGGRVTVTTDELKPISPYFPRD